MERAIETASDPISRISWNGLKCRMKLFSSFSATIVRSELVESAGEAILTFNGFCTRKKVECRFVISVVEARGDNYDGERNAIDHKSSRGYETQRGTTRFGQ